MKFKVKTIIVLAVLVLVHVIFCLSTVSAVGRVSQSWIITEPSGERKLVFRTYTTPLNTTVDDYTTAVAKAPSTDLVTENGETWTYITSSGKVENSKWIYNAPIEFPSDDQYGTARMIFHSKMFSNYDQYDSKGNWGYSLASEDITEDISSIANALANSEHIENIKPTVAETNLNKYIYYAITRISAGTYSSVSWSTGWAMKYLKEETAVEYRHAIINIGGTKNIYVADNIVQGEDLTNLIEALNGAEMCYVSEELITRSSYDKNAYEVAVTAADFIKTYQSSSNNPKGKLWSRSSRGTENDGMGSVLNLYDNILQFPQTPKRKVYVRYINIGNQDTVNSTTVDYKKVEYIESLASEKYINVGESQEKITTTKSTTAFGEYYDDIKITDLIKKTAIVRSDLIYLGHNVGVGTSLNHATNMVKAEVENGRYKIDTEVMVEGKSVYEDDDVVVIEFYYKEETPPPPPPEIEETDEPDKDISGNVFIESAEDIQTQCIDNKEGGYSIVSIPSGTRATVGIEKIPQYLLGAIDVENIGSNNNTFTFTYKFKAGPNEHSKTYTLNYDTAYYAVTNMLIYNFNGIEVYDADEDRDGTIGDSMFSWAKGVLTDNSLIKNPTVKMYGMNNVQIANSSSAITDFTNYFKGTILVGDAGGYVFKGKSINKNSHAMVKTYITESEFEKIDTNKDNIISENDKTIASNNLQAKENESKQVTSELNKANSVLYTAITKLTTLNINDNAYKGLVTQYNSVKGTTSVYSVLDNLANLSIENAAYKEAASSYKEAKTNYASFQTKAAQVEQEYNEAKNINDYIIAHYDEVYAKYKEFVQMVHLTNSQAAQELNIRAKFEIANMQVTVDGEKLFTNEGTKTQTISFEDLSKTYKVEQDRPQIEDIEYKYKVNLFGKVGNTIKRNEYNNISLIDKSILNGVRALSGKVKYESQSVIGSATTVKDTAYYNGEKAFNVKENKELSKTYNVNLTAMTAQTKYEEVEPVNVYTPITVTTEVITDTNDILDQTETGVGASLIKLNTPFTIKIGNSISESNYNFENTERFNLGYYIKFDFDVHNVKVDGKSYKSGQKIEAGTWIGFLKGNNVKVTVEAYGSGETSTLSDGNGTYTVRALAYNASEHIRDTISLYPSLSHLLASSDSDLVE